MNTDLQPSPSTVRCREILESPNLQAIESATAMMLAQLRVSIELDCSKGSMFDLLDTIEARLANTPERAAR